jgi:glycosyltransferase involved in cell wall biosynthesis/radical SAM superfamily enzyme YgiQ (UPF0313 family)
MKYKRVLLIFPDYAGGHYGALRPPAGVGYLAQVLQEGGVEHDVLDMSLGGGLSTLKKKLLYFRPDIVAISLMSFMYKRSYQIVGCVKDVLSGVTVVAGGPHVSTLREKVLEECKGLDYGIVQEGEYALLDLCKGIDVESIPGLLYRKNGKVNYVGPRLLENNLDKLPFPRFEKFEIGRYVTEEIGIVSSRGCPFNCTYCPVKTSIGQHYRARSAESIVEEITYWYSCGIRQISILDDNFTLNKKRVLEICDRICKKDFKELELNCNNGIRTDRVDKEILSAMKLAGFRYFAFGVESGNQQVLKSIKKGHNLDDIENALEIAMELNFIVTLFFIIGAPGESMVTVKDSIALAKKYPIFDARFYNLVPFPATELYEWAKSKKYLIKTPEVYLNDSSHWDFDPIFTTPEFSKEERKKALVLTRRARKDIRYRAMKRNLKKMLGPFSGIVASIYINEFVQKKLMYSSFWRRKMKRIFMKIDTSRLSLPLSKSDRVNILIISSRNEGGAAAQYYNIITKLGEFFNFFCALPDSPLPDSSPYYDKITNENISIFSLPYRTFRIMTFLKLSKWVKANNITIVHSHGGGAGIYSRLLKLLNTKLKVVHTFHGIHSSRINCKVIVERFLRILTDKFIFVSGTERQIALRHGIATASQSTLIVNGIHTDSEIYSDIDRKPVLSIFNKKITNESFIIGMLSRFDKIKNIPYAIRNLSDYLKNSDDVFLVIGGYGEDRMEIERTISEHSLQGKVVLLGFINDNKRFFLSIDIYLNTSLGEAFGFSTVEAMRYRKPVVASQVYGNSDVVDDNKTGLLFPLNKPFLLVEKIQILKNNKKIYEDISKNASKSIKKYFSLDRMLNETCELYTSLAHGVDFSNSKPVGIHTGVWGHTSNVRLNIAIDVRMIGQFKHGISRYAYNLIETISKIDKKNNYLLISNDNYLEGFVSSLDNFRLTIVNSKQYRVCEQFTIPRILRKECIDIFHSPSYFGLIYGGCKMVMTIHDCVPMIIPFRYSCFYRLYYNVVVKYAAWRACAIITVSEHAKSDINKHLGIPLNKIAVTYNAVDKIFNVFRDKSVNSVKNVYGINGRYLLYVGSMKAHKNVFQLIKVYGLLKDRTRCQLVIVGTGDQTVQRYLPEELLEGVVFIKEVSDYDLSCLYSGADLYVSTSLYEGFGLPPLEAMACGTPVAVLKTFSAYEVIGDAGVIVEESSLKGIVDAFCSILSDVNKQRSMVESGIKRCQIFSWEDTAYKTLNIYEKMMRT